MVGPALVAAISAAALVTSTAGAGHRAIPPTPLKTLPASEKKAHEEAHEEIKKMNDGRPTQVGDVLDKGLKRRAAVPHPYEDQPKELPKVRLSKEIQAMSDLVQALEQDVWKLRKETTDHQGQLMQDWIVEYNTAQDKIFHLTACPHPDVKKADKVGLASVASRRDQLKAALKKLSHAWDDEVEEYLLRQEELNTRADQLKQCIQARQMGGTSGVPPGCDKDPAGEVELKGFVQDEADYYGRMSEQKPWEIPRFKATLHILDKEEEEIKTENSKWHHSLVRRKRYRDDVEDFEETLNAMEAYFDYRHMHVLTKLADKKDRYCELEMEPAIRHGAGLIEDDVDLTPISMLMDEASILHSSMEKHRQFRLMEMHVLWQTLWMLRAALEDNHVLFVDRDIECQKHYGTKWWAWSWCRESHKHLMRFTTHDAPDAVKEKMQGLIEVRQKLMQHIMDGMDVAKASDTEPDMKLNIGTEVDFSKTYIADLDAELDTVNKRMNERKELARQLQVAQTIPNVVWIKGNVTKIMEKTLSVMQRHLQEATAGARAFQIRQGTHLIETVGRKCRRVQDHFYKGGSHDALVNKDVYEQVTQPIPYGFVNVSQGSAGGAVQELTKKALAQRARRLLSRVRQELAEPYWQL